MAEIPKARAPFSADQVASLNGYQASGVFHEFTCGNDSCPALDFDIKMTLEARTDGWHCQASGCGYAQDWAHAFMADGSWRELSRPLPWPERGEPA
jgi:hypothetical protein